MNEDEDILDAQWAQLEQEQEAQEWQDIAAQDAGVPRVGEI